jgi:putative transposase
MPIKRYKPEQIVTMLRQIEVGIANGKTSPQALKEAEITIQTFYRWRKELEKENGKLKLLLPECHMASTQIRNRFPPCGKLSS